MSYITCDPLPSQLPIASISKRHALLRRYIEHQQNLTLSKSRYDFSKKNMASEAFQGALEDLCLDCYSGTTCVVVPDGTRGILRGIRFSVEGLAHYPDAPSKASTWESVDKIMTSFCCIDEGRSVDICKSTQVSCC